MLDSPLPTQPMEYIQSASLRQVYDVEVTLPGSHSDFAVRSLQQVHH